MYIYQNTILGFCNRTILFGDMYYFHFHLEKKPSPIEKILSEEIAKNNYTIELKEKDGNALLYLMEKWKISAVVLSRTTCIYCLDHNRGESEVGSVPSGRDWQLGS
jgi:hypothetical protein